MRARARGRAPAAVGLDNKLCSERGKGLGDDRLADEEGLPRFRAEFGKQMVASEEGLAEADPIGVEAGVELAAAGVEQGANHPLIANEWR